MTAWLANVDYVYAGPTPLAPPEQFVPCKGTCSEIGSYVRNLEQVLEDSVV